VRVSGTRADRIDDGGTAAGQSARSYSRRDMLHDRRFYLLLPAVTGPAFVGTGVFFHQVALVEFKGWSLAWFAAAFAVYAGASVLATLAGGAIVDRIGARRMMHVYLVPLLFACVVLGASAHPMAAPAYMLLAGTTTGLSAAVVSTMWVELYGLAHLGAIRAMSSAIMVLSTALAPATMGLLIDHGVTLDAILWGCAVWLAAAVALAAVSMRLPPPAVGQTTD